jgi:hypothetical protein
LNLQSKPGVPAKVPEALGLAGVNIEGVCAVEMSGRGKIRMLVLDATEVEGTLKVAKIRCGREEAIPLSLENQPGALAEAAQKLAHAKVYIKCAYATRGSTEPAAVILTLSNLSKGVAALGV